MLAYALLIRANLINVNRFRFTFMQSMIAFSIFSCFYRYFVNPALKASLTDSEQLFLHLLWRRATLPRNAVPQVLGAGCSALPMTTRERKSSRSCGGRTASSVFSSAAPEKDHLKVIIRKTDHAGA